MNRMRNKSTNTLTSELQKLISEPPITLDEFEKLIPMLTSNDKEVIRLGIELLKTYNYRDLRWTISSLSAYVGVSMDEFDITQCFNKNILDELCNRKLNFAFHKRFKESVKKWREESTL